MNYTIAVQTYMTKSLFVEIYEDVNKQHCDAQLSHEACDTISAQSQVPHRIEVTLCEHLPVFVSVPAPLYSLVFFT